MAKLGPHFKDLTENDMEQLRQFFKEQAERDEDMHEEPKVETQAQPSIIQATAPVQNTPDNGDKKEDLLWDDGMGLDAKRKAQDKDGAAVASTEQPAASKRGRSRSRGRKEEPDTAEEATQKLMQTVKEKVHLVEKCMGSNSQATKSPHGG